MFQSFFQQPEISAIFSTRTANGKIKETAKENYVQGSTLRLCKQSKKRDKIIKKANRRSHHRQRPITKSQKYIARMEDANKIAMLNEENVYYDYDDETGVIVQKKHSTVSNYNETLTKSLSNSRKSDLSSLLEESLQELKRDLKAEAFLEGSCPSDSAYETTHDEIADSLEWLELTNDDINGEHGSFRGFQQAGKFDSSSQQVSPYKRCRSSAVCGRNCKLCGGSNRNVVYKIEDKNTKETNDAIPGARDGTQCESRGKNSDYNEMKSQEMNDVHTPVGKTAGSVEQSFLDINEMKTTEYHSGSWQKNQQIEGLLIGKGNENKTKMVDNTSSQRAVPKGYITEDNDENSPFLDLYVQETENDEFSCGPHLMMLYDFRGEHEDDVTVKKGELVSLLDDSDRDWVWIMTEDGEEGFVPRSLTVEYFDCEECAREEQHEKLTLQASNSINSSEDEREAAFLRSGIKMIAIASFDATDKSKLSVNKGEEIVISFKDQVVPGWLWAYSPRIQAFGFIPEQLIQPLEVSVV